MGRFISPDRASNPVTIPFANIYNPQSLNLYAYTSNNPLNRFDPDRHLDCGSAGASGTSTNGLINGLSSFFHGIACGLSRALVGGDNQSHTSVTTTQHDNYTPAQLGLQTPVTASLKTVTFNLGYSGEVGLYRGIAGSQQISAGATANSPLHMFGATTSGGFNDHNQSPDPANWVFGLTASAGASLTLSNGTEEQLEGAAHGINLAGFSFSYTGTGVYGITLPVL